MFGLLMICIFLLISMAPIIAGGVYRSRITRGCTVMVDAVIVSYESHYNYESNHNTRTPVYGYYFNGVYFQATANSRQGETRMGAHQMLYINPYNPQQCYKKEDLIFPNMAIGIGIFMCIVSFYYLCRVILDLLVV